MSIVIYKDAAANAIFIEDANGAQFTNSLQASVPTTQITITDLARQIEIVSNEDHTEFEDDNGVTYQQISINDGGTGTAAEVRDLLNAVFQSSGTPSTNAPVITSSLTINSVQGSVINYELTANFGVGYEWDLSNVPGIVTVDGNVRKLIGGSSLASGTYNIPVKAINYNGEDSETIVLTVSTPPFSNTKSVQFDFQDWLGANASLLSGILGRSGNGSGSSDAWTISFYIKGSTSTNNGQTVIYFGDNDTTNGGHLYVRYQGGNDRIRFHYGSNNNYVRFQSANSSIPASSWTHVMVTYNGGTTGSSSADVNDYYSRFKIFINGSNVISGGTWSHSNFGWSAAIDSDNFRIGRYASGNYMRGGTKIDEVAIWEGDESGNISDIYNSGTPHDLSLLDSPPDHWWRMGDGDTYPNLQDSIGTAVFVMNNMTSADIVNDVP